VTTATGDYTLSSLPARSYDLVIEAAGFKTFVSESVLVQVAQTTRVDAALEIGTTTEIVSVNAEAPLLKTANAEQGINVSGERINALPLNFGGGGGNVGAIRNWLGFVVLAPGVSGTNERASVNGAPGGGFKIYLEGQDVTSSNDTVWTSTVAAASVETIGEFSMQTANFSAEYGQVLGGLFNFTTKSGTNVLRGSAYDYLTNEAMDAERPFHRRTAPQPQAQFRLQRGEARVTFRDSTPAATRRSSSRTWKSFATGRTPPALEPPSPLRRIGTAISARR
jgi:hypothetical protein